MTTRGDLSIVVSEQQRLSQGQNNQRRETGPEASEKISLNDETGLAREHKEQDPASIAASTTGTKCIPIRHQITTTLHVPNVPWYELEKSMTESKLQLSCH